MRQTKEILKSLEVRYNNIDYYQTIIQKIEENVESHPDISIESCKALLEGLSKFIWKQIDISYDALVADKMDFHPVVRQAMTKLADLNEDIELDFVNKYQSEKYATNVAIFHTVNFLPKNILVIASLHSWL